MKIHMLEETGHDGLDVETVCGKRGWRSDCLSKQCVNGKGRQFEITDNDLLVSCRGCAKHLPPRPDLSSAEER